MTAQRLVTGYDGKGHSVVALEGPLPNNEPFIHSPGFGAALLWMSEAHAPIGGSVCETVLPLPDSVLPRPGQSSMMLVTFPTAEQHAAVENFEQAGVELSTRLPGLAERLLANAEGFHQTDTIDYAVLLEGELELLLDQGVSRQLKAGDVVVQNGTRHAWRNIGLTPAKMLFVMVGVERI